MQVLAQRTLDCPRFNTYMISNCLQISLNCLSKFFTSICRKGVNYLFKISTSTYPSFWKLFVKLLISHNSEMGENGVFILVFKEISSRSGKAFGANNLSIKVQLVWEEKITFMEDLC